MGNEVMMTFHVDEFSFEVPEGPLDRTVNVFSSASGELAVNVTRDDLPAPAAGETFASQIGKQLKMLARSWPRFMILEQKDRELGGLACREARLQWTPQKIAMYQRQIYIPYYGQLLTMTATSTKKQAAQCDAHLDRMIDGMKFRKRMS